MEDYKQLLSLNKVLRIKIDLSKDFPVTLIDDSPATPKKSGKVNLKEIVYSEDLPVIIDQIDVFMSKKSDLFYTHARIMTDDDYKWFMISCEIRKNKFARLPFMYGVILNMSQYLENVGDDPVVKEYRLKNLERISSVNTENTALADILDIEYLTQIQMPFKYSPNVYSAIFNDKNELIRTPVPKQKIFDISAFKYSKKYDIRINRSVAGQWVIASDDEEALIQCVPLLEVLAASVSRTANAYVMLYNEMTNSAQANKMLGENIERQILVNSVYSIILEQRRSNDALESVIKLIGEYIGIDRVSIFFDDKENKKLTLKYEWAVREQLLRKEKDYEYFEIPETKEQLDYVDLYYPRKNESELSSHGVRHYIAVNLNGDGIRFAVIFFEAVDKDITFTSEENKMLKNISPIIATLLLQHKIDEKLEDASEKLRHLAFNDAILDIPNRTCLDRDLSEILKVNENGAAVTLKLTNMRVFNEMFGHAYTDNLLKQIAHFIKNMASESLKIYRFSGNMLMILLPGLNGMQVKNFTETVLVRFKNPWDQDGNRHYLEAGMGISLYPENGKECEEVYRAATLALYRAVEHGANNYTFYSAEFEVPASKDYYFSQKLHNSMNEGMSGFKILYQPIINETTGNVDMCEAFINWEDGNERLSPSKLIRIAENLGFDISLDNWVIESACQFCKTIQSKYNPNFSVSVNITARELCTNSIAPMIQNALKKTGLDGKYLFVEIPEMVIAGQSMNIIPAVSQLKKCGVNVAIDSFGNDFTASSLLKYSYIDLIKTDYNLFKNVHDRFDEILIDTVLKLSKIIRHGICVKRVENYEQLENARRFGINLVQGFYYAKPLDEARFIKFINENLKKETLA